MTASPTRTGGYSLQITSQGATATDVFFNTAYDGTVEPIKTRPPETYYAQTYLYSPASNANASVQLVARLANARTGDTTDVVMATAVFTSATESQWVKLAGYVKVPVGYNQVSVGVRLPAGQSVSGNVILADDALVQESPL